MANKKVYARMTAVAAMFVMTLSLLFAPAVFAADEGTPDFTLSIMHMNDTHAHVEPMPKMVTAIKEVREVKPDALLLHGGDAFSGTLYFNEFNGQADLAMMNLMDFDAMVFGNHEFDRGEKENGHKSLSEFVEAAKFPFVSSNTAFSEDPFMKDLVGDEELTNEPDNGKIYNSIVKEVDGEKVGIFGLTTEDTKDIASPGKVKFLDYKIAAEEAVQEFKDQGINKIVALTHIGYDSNPAVGNDLLLAQIDGIDVIVGGHSHTKLGEPVVVDKDENGETKDPTVIVQAFQYAEFLGTLDVDFDNDGVVVGQAGELIEVADMEADPEAVEVLEPYANEINEMMTKETGAVALKNLPNPRQENPGDDSVRATETALGNLVTDAMLAKAKEKFSDTAIAVQNGGGIREAIDEGPITVGEVISVLPFGNDPVIVNLTGSEIKEALEHSVRQSPAESGGFLHVSGMKFTYDSTKEVGSRVQTMEVKQDDDYTPIDENETYLITTNGFTGQGGDGFDVFARAYADGRVKDIGEIDWEQLKDYMVEDLAGQVDPEIEGRIIDLKGDDPGDGEVGTSPESAADIKAVVQNYVDEGDIAGNSTARSLLLHLTAVNHFEKQEKGNKVIKHLDGFKVLLDYQMENELISEKAYRVLQADADYLIKKWE